MKFTYSKYNSPNLELLIKIEKDEGPLIHNCFCFCPCTLNSTSHSPNFCSPPKPEQTKV